MRYICRFQIRPISQEPVDLGIKCFTVLVTTSDSLKYGHAPSWSEAGPSQSLFRIKITSLLKQSNLRNKYRYGPPKNGVMLRKKYAVIVPRRNCCNTHMSVQRRKMEICCERGAVALGIGRCRFIFLYHWCPKAFGKITRTIYRPKAWKKGVLLYFWTLDI